MADKFRSNCDDLQKFFLEEVENEKRLREEISAIRTDYDVCRNRYERIKLENEEIQQLLDQQVAFRCQMDNETINQLNHFQKDFENVLKEMDDVLDDFNAEKEAERLSAMQTYQAFKDIPNSFSDEAMTGKIIKTNEKIAAVQKEIAEITKQRDNMKEIYNVEVENFNLLDGNVNEFNKDIKTTVVKLNRSVHRK